MLGKKNDIAVKKVLKVTPVKVQTGKRRASGIAYIFLNNTEKTHRILVEIRIVMANLRGFRWK